MVRRWVVLICMVLCLATTAQADITTNLAAWYKLDEQSGTNAADSSGNALNGTINGTPTFTANCKVNGCITFGGSNDYVSLPNNATLNITSSIPLAAWVNTSGSTLT